MRTHAIPCFTAGAYYGASDEAWTHLDMRTLSHDEVAHLKTLIAGDASTDIEATICPGTPEATLSSAAAPSGKSGPASTQSGFEFGEGATGGSSTPSSTSGEYQWRVPVASTNGEYQWRRRSHQATAY
jgi:hypothetical protein